MSKRLPPPYHFGSKILPGLSKLMEEAGELIQVIGKITAMGHMGKHWDGSNLKERLEDEMADVQAAILFFCSYNGMNGKRMGERVREKVALFEQWHREQG